MTKKKVTKRVKKIRIAPGIKSGMEETIGYLKKNADILRDLALIAFDGRSNSLKTKVEAVRKAINTAEETLVKIETLESEYLN